MNSLTFILDFNIGEQSESDSLKHDDTPPGFEKYHGCMNAQDVKPALMAQYLIR